MNRQKIAALAAASLGAFALHSLAPAAYYKYISPAAARKTGAAGTLMLTFDDGPSDRYTERILDLLAKYQVKAVFFVVLREVRGREALIKRIVEEGHMVGFHSTTHKNSMLSGYLGTKRDLEAGLHFLKGLGVREFYYRPPWGHCNLFTGILAKRHGMKIVLWDVMAGDWKKNATSWSIFRAVTRKVKDQSIICLHDGGENSGGAKNAPVKTIEALEWAIPKLKGEGYRFIRAFD